MKIEFLCAPEDKGVIAPPIPARTVLPDWYRKLGGVDHDAVTPQSGGLSIKRCLPFLDAMTHGWVLPLAATVRLEISNNGATLNAGWDFDRTMVSFHAPEQVAGHPNLPRPPAKLHNYWTIRTPKGWSCLFVAPLNRANGVFEIVAGVVDTDAYHAHIHLPFFASAPDGRYTLEKGTPVAQVIPFKRSAPNATIRAETDHERAVRTRTHRATQAGDGWYRLNARAKRD